MKKFLGKVKNFIVGFKNKLGIKKFIAVCIAIILVILLLFSCGGKKVEQKSYVSADAYMGNIVETVEQSGTVEPYERREITALVRGEIIDSPYNEGDLVEEGDTLYRIDDEDAQLSLERSQINLDEVNESINNLKVYAPVSGVLSNFSLSEGDYVNGGEIGKIQNSDNMKVQLSFTPSDFDKIRIGDRALVTSAMYMTSLEGTVTYKIDSASGTATEGSYLKKVEITIPNPGALAEGTTVHGTVFTASETVYSADSRAIENGGTTSLRAESQGEVENVYVKNGDKVKKGQLLAVLSNRSLNNSKKTTELSLRSEMKNLEDYNITAPISGTVITKNVEKGDKIDNSNVSTVLMVVADMSKMKFTISVDELDIGRITIGQDVRITADALPDDVFMGYVSKIAAEGTVSGQGVTTFDVEIVIDEPGELKSGMNVNANIIISETKNVLIIPEEALNGAKNKKATVYVAKGKVSKDAVFPDDFVEREVEYGNSNGELVEIISGLQEGETVYYIQYSGNENEFMKMMRGMHGGDGGSGGMVGPPGM
ncbi:MAG: efflux RND transporter periplasmic adaptor subunit [Clostridia bacterium]|nr:efflux RND transporter periplasmic adaptor subunit [Clostridia bacterium]